MKNNKLFPSNSSKLGYLGLASIYLASMAATPVLADPNEKPSILDTVVSTAGKTKQRLGDVDSTVSVISEDDISENIMTSVDDLFQLNPSTSTTSGRGGSINIRGIEGNRVLILVDGVKQPKVFDYGPLQSSRNAIDLNTIKLVEVLPTPASSLYGGGSVGGIIAYTTKDPSDFLDGEDDTFGGQVNLRYNGSDSSFSKSVSLAGKSGQTEAMVILTHHNGNEVENKGKVDTKGNDFDKNSPEDFTNTNILAKLNTKLSNDLTLKFIAEQTNTLDDITGYRTTTISDYEDKTLKRRFSAELISTKSNDYFDELSTRFNYQNKDSESLWEYQFGPTPSTYLGTYDETDTSLSMAFKKQITSDSGLIHNLNYGLSLEKDTFEQGKVNSSGTSRSMPKAEQVSAGLYIQDQIKINERLTVTPGVRFDTYEVDPKPDAEYLASSGGTGYTSPDKSNGSKASLKLGATYDLNERQTVFGQFAQGYKAPDLNELYQYSARSYRVDIPNPDLKPESSDSFEIGHRFEGDKLSTEVVAFANFYTDFIDDLNTGLTAFPVTYRTENLTDTLIKGLEFKGSYDINDDIQILGAVAYAKGTYKSDDGDTTPLNSVSPLSGVISVGYDHPSDKWGGKLLITASADKAKSDMEDSSKFQSKGYSKTDLTGYYQFNKSARLNYGVYNIFDKTYWNWQELDDDQEATDTRNSGAARHFKVGITVDL